MAKDTRGGEHAAPFGDLIDSSAALGALSRAEVDLQISTAHRYPRDENGFAESMRDIIEQDEEIAADMFFRLPRGGDVIEGPSVRMAELIASKWGNLRVQSRVIGIDARFVTAQGMAHDLESNLASSVEVQRRITDKKGNRFGDDMIQVTANAACSIAMRQAIFKVVPFTYARKFLKLAQEVSTGGVKQLKQRVGEMLRWFGKFGIEQAQILAVLQVKSVADITSDNLTTLKGLATAIRDGEVKIEEVFHSLEPLKSEAPTQKPKGAAQEATVGALLGEEESVEAKEEKPQERPKGRQRTDKVGSSPQTTEPPKKETASPPEKPAPRKPETASRNLLDQLDELEEEEEESPVQDEKPKEEKPGDDQPSEEFDVSSEITEVMAKIAELKQPARIRKLMMEISRRAADFFEDEVQAVLQAGEARLEELAKS